VIAADSCGPAGSSDAQKTASKCLWSGTVTGAFYCSEMCKYPRTPVKGCSRLLMAPSLALGQDGLGADGTQRPKPQGLMQ
jgi:hypothetical protein